MKSSKHLALFLVILVASIAATFFTASSTFAVNGINPPDCSEKPFGRCLREGYFTGNAVFADDGFPGNQQIWPASYNASDELGNIGPFAIPSTISNANANSAEEFISLMQTNLFGQGNLSCDPGWNSTTGNPTNQDCYDRRRRAFGAAFLIESMLGVSGTNFNSTAAGVSAAQGNFNNWAKIIRNYQAANRITWTANYNDPAGHLNSTSVGRLDLASDVSIFRDSRTYSAPVIIFTSPNGARYIINRRCANSTGELGGIYDFGSVNNVGTLSAISPTPGSSITAGTKIQLRAGMDNNGSADGGAVSIELKSSGTQYLTRSAPQPCPTGTAPGQDPELLWCGYDSGQMADGTNDGHYWWTRKSSPHNGATAWSVQYQPVEFTVAQGTPNGTQLCFVVFVSPPGVPSGTSGGGVPICYGVGVPGNPPGGGGSTGTLACSAATTGIATFPNVSFSWNTSSGVPTPQSGPPADGSFGATYTQYVPQGTSKVTGEDDTTTVKGGTPNQPPTLVSEGSGSATVSYQPFANNYPYDYNKGGIRYVNYYTIKYYSATGTSFPHYSNCSWNDANHNGVQDLFEVNCTVTYTYAYVSTGETPNNATSEMSQDGPQMNPCADRSYKNTTAVAYTPQFDDEENPSKATFTSSVNVSMDLGGDSKLLRSSLKVKLDVSANFYVQHADGSTQSWPQAKQSGELSGTNFLLDSGSTYVPSSGSRSFTDVFTATFPTMRTGDKACVTVTASPQTGRMNVAGDRTSGTGSSTSNSCSDASPLVDKPYFKVYGSDVQAGGAFTGGNCTQTGTISAFYRDSTKAGAGAQFAALALGQITGFSSATLRGSGTPTRPLGLSFANTGTNTAGESMGGNFGTSHCITDYWSNKPTSVTAQNLNSYANVAGATGAVYLTPPSGTATLSGGDNITGRKTIYVDGNVVLSGNYSYASSGSWADENAIPSLFIIARGNIYVDKDTTQLDGTYVAQPHSVSAPTDGKIYTCATGTTPVPLGSLFASCSKQLTINGAFVASQVKLLRTYGSLRHATTDEEPRGSAHGCNPSGSTSAPVCAAEVFNFSPEVYLAQPALPIVRSAYQGKYDYITSLPPTL